MRYSFTKHFPFSASHESSGKIIGHNYVLGVTVAGAPGRTEEEALERGVRETLIGRLESRDLGLHVDFLKGKDITDENLLRAFADLLSNHLKQTLVCLTLERDRRTVTTLELGIR